METHVLYFLARQYITTQRAIQQSFGAFAPSPASENWADVNRAIALRMILTGLPLSIYFCSAHFQSPHSKLA